MERPAGSPAGRSSLEARLTGGLAGRPKGMTEPTTGPSRRFLKTRQKAWAAKLAAMLARSGATPNQVSVAGVVFAALAGLAFMNVTPDTANPARFWLLGALCVQLRLLCNMLDGLLAIEHGMKGKLGEMWNDIPDRLSDSFILVGAGYSVEWLVPGGSALGWCAALLAMLTAYIRVLGGALGTTQYFTGPMAKQHRMFVITLGALLAAFQTLSFTAKNWSMESFRPGWVMAPALIVIVLGSAVTAVRRTQFIARDLSQ